MRTIVRRVQLVRAVEAHRCDQMIRTGDGFVLNPADAFSLVLHDQRAHPSRRTRKRSIDAAAIDSEYVWAFSQAPAAEAGVSRRPYSRAVW